MAWLFTSQAMGHFMYGQKLSKTSITSHIAYSYDKSKSTF